MSGKIEVVAYANGDDLSNLLDDRTAVVVGVADGWRSTGLVRHIDHQVEVNRLYEWARANQQLAQSAMDKLEEALADCDNLKMHLADHRKTLDALSLGVDPTAPAVERQESKRPKWMDEQFAMAARGERQTVVGTIADLSAEIDRLNGVVAEAVSLLDLQSDELCKRRFRIADLEAEVNTAPFEAKLISAGFGYPMSKEDAVKAYKASLQPRTDHPGNEDCEWCHGCGHDPYGNPCAGCCSPPAPVAVDDLQAIQDRHEEWMAGVEQGKAESELGAIKESEEFEKWRNAQIDVLIRNGYPEGADAFLNLGSVQWAGWQARACLVKVKEMNR